jgi:hypothetical protein
MFYRVSNWDTASTWYQGGIRVARSSKHDLLGYCLCPITQPKFTLAPFALGKGVRAFDIGKTSHISRTFDARLPLQSDTR